MSTTFIVLLVLSAIFAIFQIQKQNETYESTKKEEDKVGLGTVLFWIVAGLIFVFGCFGNLVGGCGGDLSRIGGQ